MNTAADLQTFAEEFRDGLIGIQPKASRGMCALVSVPLRAAFKVLRGIDTDLVTENGHTFLMTSDGRYCIDPTMDQFARVTGITDKVLVEKGQMAWSPDDRLAELSFVELLEHFKRLTENENSLPGPRKAGEFVAQFVYAPLAQQGFFEGHMTD